MITRDNKASISGTAQNARQRFGEVLKYHRVERNLSVREVAHRCKVSVGTVEEWEDGKQLPNSDEWKALCRGVNRGLNPFNELFLRARAEANDEAKARAGANMKADTKINNTLGSKIAAAITPTQVPLAIVPPPPEEKPPAIINRDQDTHARKTSEALQKLPAGWKTHDSIQKRRQFVLELIRQRPTIRASGNDSVVEALKKTFGVTMASYTIEEIREQVKREIEARGVAQPLPASLPPGVPDWREPVEIKVPLDAKPNTAQQKLVEMVAAAPVEVKQILVESQQQSNHESEINTAVSLILDAIPGLQTFTIAVDEHGEASVDFQIRKVRVETVGGSMKVKR